MKNLKLVVLAALVLLGGMTFAQTAPQILVQAEYQVPEVLQKNDQLLAIGNEKVLPYFKHQIKPKETLYSIAKAYGASLQDIIQMNPKLDPANLKLEAELIVPLSPNKFVSNKELRTKRATAVKYQVLKGQTQFAIAHRIFQIPIADILENNPSTKNGISPGQRLLIGWIIQDDEEHDLASISPAMIEATPANARVNNGDEEIETRDEKELVEFKSETPNYELAKDRPTNETAVLLEPNSTRVLDNEVEPAPQKTELVELKGKVATKKTASFTGRYVLSSVIPVNTEVEVFNPMSGRSSFAKVIAPLPRGLYTQEVMAVLSGSLAEDLRAMDSQFYVYVRYLK